MGNVTLPLDGGLGWPADAPFLGPLPGTLTAFRPSPQRGGQAGLAPAALLSGLPVSFSLWSRGCRRPCQHLQSPAPGRRASFGCGCDPLGLISHQEEQGHLPWGFSWD